MGGCGIIYARFFEVMGSPVPSNQARVSVAVDTFTPRLLKAWSEAASLYRTHSLLGGHCRLSACPLPRRSIDGDSGGKGL